MLKRKKALILKDREDTILRDIEIERNIIEQIEEEEDAYLERIRKNQLDRNKTYKDFNVCD